MRNGLLVLEGLNRSLEPELSGWAPYQPPVVSGRTHASSYI